MDRILRLPEVITTTGLSRSSIYSRITQGTFPKQIRLGKKMVGWFESDIEQWLSGMKSSE